MSHEVETAMYVGEAAWHRVGTVLENPPTIEEGIIAAGLHWTVEKRPLWCKAPDGRTLPIDSHMATVRTTDDRVLGVVGRNYEVVQNLEAFQFFNELLDSGLMHLEAAGSLQNGRKVWVMAKLNGWAAEVSPGDPVECYLVLYNSHDGSVTVGILWTPVRVVCMNTLRAATQGFRNQGILKIRHTKNVLEALELVKEAVDVERQTFGVTIETFRAMQRRRLDIDGLEQYVRVVFQRGALSEDEFSELPPMPRCWEEIQENFENGRGAKMHRGTLWGGFNAITEWIDHGRGKDSARRMESSLWSAGAHIRDRAYEEASRMLLS